MNRFPRALLLNIFLLVSFSLMTQLAHADEWGDSEEPFQPKWGKVTDEEWAMGAPGDYPEANAIILFNVGKIEVTDDRIKIDYHLRAKVLTQAGVEEAGDWSFYWFDKTDHIKNFEAHTITPDGKKHKIDKKTIFETEVGDYHQKKFAFSQLAPGVIIEYKFTHLSERFWHLRPWYFQNEYYTMLSQVTTGVAPGFAYNVDFFNVPVQNRTASESKYLDRTSNSSLPEYIKTFTWKMENIPPITDEPYMSAENDYRAYIRFQLESFEYGLSHYSFIKSWPEEGDDFRKYYIIDFDNGTGRVKEIVKRITDGLTTDREKSKAIYRWVADSISTTDDRYGTWFFRKNIDEILDLGSGGGEDKNFLVHKMHNIAGISSWPVLISTRLNGRFNPRQGDYTQFNYLITFVQLGNEWEFLDAAGAYTPYGILPPHLLTDGGLLLDGSNSDLVRITIKPTNSQRFDSSMIVIEPTGEVTGDISCLFTGYSAAGFSEKKQETPPDELVDDMFADQVSATCDWGEPTYSRDSMDNSIVNINFTSPEMTSILGDNLTIRPLRLKFGENPFVSDKRFFPVDFMFPFGYTNRVDILYKGDYSEIDLPSDTSFQILGASFVRQCTVKDSIATVVNQLIVEQPSFSPQEYDKLRDFFETVALCKEDQVAFIK